MIGAESALSTFPAEMNKVTGRVDALDKKVTAVQKAAAAKPATASTPASPRLPNWNQRCGVERTDGKLQARTKTMPRR